MVRKSSAAAVAAAMIAAAVPAAAAAAPLPATSKAPSTATAPYVLPVAPGVHTRSLLTVGDSVGGYKMVGIPDGLGAFDAGHRRFGLVMNHELPATQGVTRAHGQAGAFVSSWRIDRNTHAVTSGEDLIEPGVQYWDYRNKAYTTSIAPLDGLLNADGTFNVFSPTFARLCSSSLTEPGQLFNARTGRGTREQIYFANEENGDEGRLFGVTLDGKAKQLPRLGLFSWENTLAADTRTDTTLVMGQEDAAGGQLWVYRGTKTKKGDAFERAGLTNGVDLVISAGAVKADADFRATHGTGTDVPVDLEIVDWNQSGKEQNAEAAADGLTLNRIEDGAWDPRPGKRNSFYFVTTEGAPRADGSDGGGVWKLEFEDLDRPELGATLTLLLDGSETWAPGEPGAYKPDNVAVDVEGNMLIQEDPGNAAHVARILALDVDTGTRGVVARFDPALFGAGAPGLITQDEESSGIIDVREHLGRGWYAFDAQVHKAIPAPDPDGLVQQGQLLLLKVDSWRDVYRSGTPAS